MSKEIFEKNDAMFYREYQRHLPEYKENPAYKIIKSNNGKDIVQVHLFEDQYLRMSSIYDPNYEASRWADQYHDETKNTILAIYGFGNYYYIKHLLENSREDDRYVIYEPNEDFFAFVCYHFDITEIIDTAKVFIVLPSMSENTLQDDILFCVPLYGSADIRGITMPGYSASQDFIDICKKVQLLRDSNKGFLIDLGRQSVYNCFYAVNELQYNYSLSYLKEKIKDLHIPVIVVAAGPSLRDNGALLKEFKDKAIIICVDRAALVLRELGVRPHFISTIDAAKPLSMMAKEDVMDIPIISDPDANYKIQEMYRGQIIYTYEDELFQNLPGYSGKCTFPYSDSGGSVATWSYNVAVELGAKTVILVGQDLALKNGYSHADGTKTEDEEASAYVEEVDGIDGNKTFARYDWIRFRNFYEDSIKRNSDVRLIDATEGGALIHGSDVMTLQEVLDTVCTEQYDISDIIKSMPPAQNDEEKKATRDYIVKMVEELTPLTKTINETKQIADQLRRLFAYHKPHDSYMLKKLQAFNKSKDEMLEFPLMSKLIRYSVQNSDTIPSPGHDILTDKDGQKAFEDYIIFLNKLLAGIKLLEMDLKEIFDIS